MRARTIPLAILALLLAGAVALTPGCSSDSPSEPAPPPGGGGGGGGGASFNITVTATPATLEAGGDDASTIRVQVRRADNGQPPANGTTAVVTTTAGTFGMAGGQSSAVLSLTGGDASVLLFPPADPGSAVVRAQLQNSVGQVQVQFAEADAFFVGFVDPGIGAPGGGDQVTVRGGGFESPVRVTFGSAPGQVLSVGPNAIQVVTPPSPSPGDQQAVVDVSVIINLNEEDQANDTLASGFTYTPGGSTEMPTVLSVTPQSGPNEGGTNVVITGSGFAAPVQVLFGQGTVGSFEGIEATIRSVTPTRIEVVSPAAVGPGQNNQNQTVAILVRNQNSGFADVEPSAFSYGTDVLITSFGPGSAPYFGGIPMTVFGQGFDAPVAVSVAGVGQQPTSVSGTEVVVNLIGITTTSCSDVTGPVGVTNIESGDSAQSGSEFTWRVEAFGPVFFDIDPNSGPQTGNTLVTLIGNNLFNPLVTFDERPAATVSVAGDGTEVDVRTPFFPDEGLRTESCDDNMDGTEGERFLPTAVDVTVVNLDTTCEFTFPDAFVYNPTNTTCRNDVGPPPAP